MSLSQTLRRLLNASFPSASSLLSSSASSSNDSKDESEETDDEKIPAVPASSSPPHPEDSFSINFLPWPEDATGIAPVEVLSPSLSLRRSRLGPTSIARIRPLSRTYRRMRARLARSKRRARVEVMW